MFGLRNTTAISLALAGMSLLGVGAQAQVTETVQGAYDATNNTIILDINNLTGVDFSNVILTESVIANPAVTDSTVIGTIAAGTTATLNTSLQFPITFGNNPNIAFSGFPLNFTVSADYFGNTHTVTFNQDNNLTGGYVPFEGIGENGNPDGIAVPLTTLAAVPEPSAVALLATSGLSGLALLTRKRRK